MQFVVFLISPVAEAFTFLAGTSEIALGWHQKSKQELRHFASVRAMPRPSLLHAVQTAISEARGGEEGQLFLARI